MKTVSNWIVRLASVAAGVLLSAGLANAQTEPAGAFPSKPIRIVVPYPAGGSTDMLARMFGKKFTEFWGQPVIVENKPGASGWIGNGLVAKAPADGYTILLTISSIVYADSLYSKLPYDVVKDFEPVSLVSRTPNLLAVPVSVPANTLEEFVELVRRNPGKFNYGSFGQGTTSHIFGETLNRQAELDMVHVAYKGAAPLVSDLLGGQVTSGFVDAGTIRPHLKSGKVRILAASGTQRVTYLPDVPTFTERGYKGFEPVGYYLVLAPAGTPKDIVKKISDAIAAVVRAPENAARIEDLGQHPVGSTPQELAAAMKSDAEIFDRVIKQANIRIEN